MPRLSNRIVTALPRAARAHLLALAELVDVESGEILSQTGRATRHVYFPVCGFCSLMTVIDDHPAMEIGMIGHEGMLGGHVALASRRDPIVAQVHGVGRAYRIAVRPFRDELARSPVLRKLMAHYAGVLLVQRARVAGCMHYHAIGPRLARWLLMNQDRAQSDHLPVTQEFISTMLGVRRVSVTVAASRFQRDGLIEYHRGDLTILDRDGLEGQSCSCYAFDLQVYAAYMRTGAAADRTPVI